MYDEIRVIDLDGLVKAKSPCILYSEGAGPCIAIGFYDPPTKTGYMVHELPSGLDNGKLREIIGQLAEECKDLSKIRVRLVGGSLLGSESDLEKNAKLNSLGKIVRTLKTSFSPKLVRTYIGNTPDDVFDLTLHTKSGKFEVQKFSARELEEESNS